MNKKTESNNPDIVVWELTLACNLNCLHCGSSAGKKRPDELSTKEALGLCHDLSDINSMGIALMGGEVFTLKKAKLPFLTLYIQVDDINEKTKLIEELGGFILEPPFEIPSGSRICLFNEPSGVTLAMLERKKK